MDTVTYRRGAYDALVALNIPQKFRGFEVAEKVIAAIAAGEEPNLQKLYSKIGVSPVAASRNIRSICKKCELYNSPVTIESIFGNKGKLTAKEFLTTLAGRVIRGISI